MKKIIDSLPAQIKGSLEAVRGVPVKRKKYTQVLICGMGGSGISGSIAQALYPQIRILTNSDYMIPHGVDRHTLAIIISYSGNTEETLANYTCLARRGVDMAVITSNGRLVKKNALARVRVPTGFPPRGALGYLFTPIPMILHACGLMERNPTRELSNLAGFLEKERSRITTRARSIASRIEEKLPIVYVNSYRFHPVARRWQCQFNENAKILAHVNIIPEMNHNEIVGIGHPASLRNRSRFILLHDPHAHPRNDLRARILPRVVQKDMPPLVSVMPRGSTPLHHVFWTIWLGDYVSYYCALQSGIDPLPVKRIDRLKILLSKN
ncbi:bifunctional phosphoglucose/phosphomannose isomerase [candidate division WOR-3 bacterium]|nr:bifunctional phosphoglucose/phosphomannose isomerase [candidate division WOR-3 bacterium]